MVGINNVYYGKAGLPCKDDTGLETQGWTDQKGSDPVSVEMTVVSNNYEQGDDTGIYTRFFSEQD